MESTSPLTTLQRWRDHDNAIIKQTCRLISHFKSSSQNSYCPCIDCKKERFSNRVWGVAFSIIGGALVIFAFLFLRGCSVAHASEDVWSDEEIVNAIYKAEGGENAKYPYGIRSVKCTGLEECRTICHNTVKNNRVRFANAKRLPSEDFVAFLGKRYCPTAGPSLSFAEQKLNGNWERNVRFFLKKNRGIK